MHKALRRLLTASVLISLLSGVAWGQVNDKKPKQLDDVGVDEQLGDTIPFDATFVTSDKDTVTLGQLMKGDQPVILNPVYYECPMLCNLVLNGLFDAVKQLKWQPGKEYKIITVSIDPGETPELAKQNKTNYLDSLNTAAADSGWYFLTGSQEQIDKLTQSVGFKFKYDPVNDQYAHAASIIFLSPNGKISRYLYGIEFSQINMRNALYDAADGTIGNTIDQIVMYCYQYDPSSRSYTPVAVNIMKLGGLVTAVFLGIFLGFFWLREKRSSNSINHIDGQNE
jgi:protein SCO1/2